MLQQGQAFLGLRDTQPHRAAPLSPHHTMPDSPRLEPAVDDGEPVPPHQAVETGDDGPESAGDGGSVPFGRPRTHTTTAEIGSTLGHPGSVKINVQGAFIVDQESATPANGGRGSPDGHQTKDIRLPNHTAVVSHLAVDVRRPAPSH